MPAVPMLKWGCPDFGCACAAWRSYVVDKASSNAWKGGVGYLTADILKAHIPAPGPDTLVRACCALVSPLPLQSSAPPPHCWHLYPDAWCWDVAPPCRCWSVVRRP